MFTKCSKTCGDTTNSKNPVVSSVALLLFLCCPTAISRFIVSIVVDAFYCLSFRLISHVAKKVDKGHPPLADAYSPASIVFETVLARMNTPRNHLGPALVRSRLWLSPRCVPVNETCRSNDFSSEAFAGLDLASRQMRVGNLNDFTAIASAYAPSWTLTAGICSAWRLGNHFQSSEFLSDKVLSFTHSIGHFFAVFSGGRPATTGARYDSFLSKSQGFVNAL